MEDIDRLLARIANRRKGIVTREAGLAEGISEATMDNRVRAGILIPLYDGVYRHAAVPFTQDLRDLAAVLACGPDAVLSHRAAARRHHFPNVKRAKPEVTSPHKDLPRAAGFDRHRSLRLHPAEIATRDGIPITAKGRTAMDYCAVTPLWIAQEVIVEAVITKILKPHEVFAVLDRSGGRGCRGTADLRTIATGFDDLEDLESMLELVVAGVLDRASVPFDRQVSLVCADGRNVRLDFAIPELHIGLDANGKRWHDTPARKRRTIARHESIVATGWTHLMYGWAEANDEQARIRQEVEAAIAERLGKAA